MLSQWQDFILLMADNILFYVCVCVCIEAETPILWPPDVKSWLIWKDPDAGKGWRWEEKGTTEDEMVGWHHWLKGHEFEQGLGFGDGQGGLTCCSPWGRKESDTTEWLNWTELVLKIHTHAINISRQWTIGNKKKNAWTLGLISGSSTYLFS